MKYISFLFIVMLSSVRITSGQTPPEGNPNLIAAMETIRQEDLMKTVNFLSSKELAGRLPGHKGYQMAVEYMAEKFKSLGLKTINDNNYFQDLAVEYNEIISPVKLNLTSNGSLIKEYRLGNDFVCRGITGSGSFIAPLAFCGYGISKPEAGYDDYTGIDVKGKIVIVFKANPSWKGIEPWGDNYPREKAKTAADHGAKGILFVSSPNDSNPQKTIVSVLHGDGIQNENLPQFHIDIPAADDFLQGTSYTLKKLQTLIDSAHKPHSVVINSVSAEIEVHAKYEKEKIVQNVVACFEGADPVLRNEYIVIGAHLDHVGSQGDIYLPGANDNASGSAAVLEIAEAFVSGKVKAKRSIIFVLFASEEQGLFGSKYFTDNSPVPIKNITAMINLDCIAHGDSIQAGNGKSAPQLWNIAYTNDLHYTKMMVKNTWGGGGADAQAFHDKGIPSIYFATTNSYTHLHYMTDTPATLNRILFEKLTRLVFLTAVEISEGNYTKETVMVGN